MGVELIVMVLVFCLAVCIAFSFSLKDPLNRKKNE